MPVYPVHPARCDRQNPAHPARWVDVKPPHRNSTGVVSALREEVRSRLERLDVQFGPSGTDAFGISKAHLQRGFETLGWLHQQYFRVTVHGIDRIPNEGRAMLVCNHAGGLALDGALVVSACFFDHNPPRLAHGMADRFLAKVPFVSHLLQKTGQVVGHPRHATQLLNDGRLLMVFPEGSRGTAKLFEQRYDLVKFGTGFMRQALETGTPVVPVAFLGAGDAIPTVANLKRLGRFLGMPYVPVTPYLLPIPLPVPIAIHFGHPVYSSGTGREDDAIVDTLVREVKDSIANLLRDHREDYEQVHRAWAEELRASDNKT